jgi:hypothetical protein
MATERYLELVGILAIESETLPALLVAGPSKTGSKGKEKGKVCAEPSNDKDGGMAEENIEGLEGFMKNMDTT